MSDNSEAKSQAAHRAEATERLSPIGKRMFKFIEFDDDEELVTEIRKHPIGLIGISLTGVFISLAILVSTVMLALNINNMSITENDASIKAGIVGIGLLLVVIVLIATLVILVVYLKNVIYVTNEKIAEVAYISLFNREITQLSLGRVEDVTVEQKGILPRVFDYGTIIIETAGELENCIFTLVPRPNYYSRKIIEAHEDSIEKYGN